MPSGGIVTPERHRCRPGQSRVVFSPAIHRQLIPRCCTNAPPPSNLRRHVGNTASAPPTLASLCLPPPCAGHCLRRPHHKRHQHCRHQPSIAPRPTPPPRCPRLADLRSLQPCRTSPPHLVPRSPRRLPPLPSHCCRRPTSHPLAPPAIRCRSCRHGLHAVVTASKMPPPPLPPHRRRCRRSRPRPRPI